MENPSYARAGVSRFSAFVLGFVVVICVLMIGGGAYLKYQLDHAQSVLAAPDEALTSDTQNQNPAEARLAAQHQAQFWAMGLTLVCWISLIIAAACTAGIYLVLRARQAAPLRALAQSIENLAKGDMNAAIWGVERQDVIGEVARAVDVARYQFGHLPDLSLISDQGPIRLKFEGGSRSLFEAMMKTVATDAENIRAQSSMLTESAVAQKTSLTAMSHKVEEILHNISQRGHSGDMQIKKAIADMTGSAENMKNAHAHAADQLSRLIPHIQERAQGLAEITQIAGKQIALTLQSLAASEYSLKSNAAGAQETLTKLSSTADNLGERLFGAINLLQAGGKVLAETTESIKTRIDQKGESTQIDQEALASLATRMDEVKTGLASLQTKFTEQSAAQAERPAEIFSADSIMGPLTKNFEEIVAQLNLLQTRLGDYVAAQNSKAIESAPTADISGPIADKFELLTAQLTSFQAKLAQQDQLYDQYASIEAKISELSESNKRAALLASSLPGDLRQSLREEIQSQKDTLTKEPPVVVEFPPQLQKQLMDQWFQMSGQIEATRASLFTDIAQKIDAIETRLAGKSPSTPSESAIDTATQIQLEKQAEVLGELVGTLSLIDTHMQQIREELHAVADRA